MINGAHVIIYTTDAEADRAFFRDVLQFPAIDAGQGWLIFALPPAEAAFHPAEDERHHELFLMCSDLTAVLASLNARKVPFEPPLEARWGTITRVALPSGGQIGLYQPKHPTALNLRPH